MQPFEWFVTPENENECFLDLETSDFLKNMFSILQAMLLKIENETERQLF